MRVTRAFFASLPWRSRLVIFTAVFFTFGSVGFIDDIWNVRAMSPWACVLTNVVYVGFTAVLYIVAFSTTRWLVPVAFAFQFGGAKLLPALCGWMGGGAAAAAFDAAAIKHRLDLDGIGCILCITIGYGVFIRFIAWEGRKHMRLRTEVALAERLHAALVPPVAVATPRFEAYGRAEPSSEVGGDLLDVVERDGALVACVADVSGHGVSAGAFMGMVKSAFRMRLLTADRLDALLDDLDAVVAQLRSPEMFVTFAGARFDGSQQAELALAGHLPILHYCRGTDTIVPIENQRPPLGVVERARHTSSRVGFGPGDLFVFVTDGVTEVANARGEQLGIGAVEQTIRRHVGEPLADIYAAVLDAARRHGRQTDDQTLLLVRAR